MMILFGMKESGKAHRLYLWPDLVRERAPSEVLVPPEGVDLLMVLVDLVLRAVVGLEVATTAPVFGSWSERFAEFCFEVCFDFFESFAFSSSSGSLLEL